MGKDPGKGHHFGESNNPWFKPISPETADSGQGSQPLSLSGIPFISCYPRKNNVCYPEILRGSNDTLAMTVLEEMSLPSLSPLSCVLGRLHEVARAKSALHVPRGHMLSCHLEPASGNHLLRDSEILKALFSCCSSSHSLTYPLIHQPVPERWLDGRNCSGHNEGRQRSLSPTPSGNLECGQDDRDSNTGMTDPQLERAACLPRGSEEWVFGARSRPLGARS